MRECCLLLSATKSLLAFSILVRTCVCMYFVYTSCTRIYLYIFNFINNKTKSQTHLKWNSFSLLIYSFLPIVHHSTICACVLPCLARFHAFRYQDQKKKNKQTNKKETRR